MQERTIPWWGYGVLFLLGLLVALGGAALQTNPGYMDAFYYFQGGVRIVAGHGGQEMFIWNYLGDPSGLPTPAFAYWMPLTSVVAAVGIWLLGGSLPAFEAAQAGFVLLGACVPPLTAALANALTGRKGAAWLAGGLAGFTGFYLPFLTTTDSFTLFMVLGGLFFLGYLRFKRARGFLLGLLAGLMHMARADGLLWLGVAGLGGLFDLLPEDERLSWKQVFGKLFSFDFVRAGLMTVAGYLLVMAPWFWRNLDVFGGLFPPGSSRAIWALDYNDLYAYPASQLTGGRWWQAGVGALLEARWDALLANLQTTYASMGVFLPGFLATAAFWRNRRRNVIRLGLTGLAVLFATMTLVFPFSGARGSYFHSGAAFVPLILALAPDGIDALTKFSLRIFKTWEDRRIRPFYNVVVVLMVVLFSGYTYVSAVIGLKGDPVMVWNQVSERYVGVDAALDALGAEDDDLVLTANPPALMVVAGRPSVGMPDGDTETLQLVASDFGVRWVLLEPNHPDGLDDFYDQPQDVGGLTLVETAGDVYIFRWEGTQP